MTFMKKFIWLLLLTGTMSPAFAQDPVPSDQKVNLSLFAGTGVMWAGSRDKDQVSSSGAKFLFNYGLNIDYRLGRNYDFSTGINHLMGGSGLSYLQDSINFRSLADTVKNRLGPNALVKYKLQYIQIPLLLKLKTNEIGYSTYFLEFGLTPGINIRSIADIETHNNSNLNPTNVKFNKDVAFANLDFTAGAGWHYSLTGNTALIVFLQFHNGLIDFTRDDEPNNTAATVLRSLLLGAGFGF